MPGGGKYGNYSDTLGTSPFGADGSRGVSSKNLLKKLFPQPSTGDLLTKDGVAATANRELIPNVLPKNPDPTIWSSDNLKLGFGDTPDISQGPFSGQDKLEGGPANAYFPNLTSPDPSGAGSVAPIIPTKLDGVEVNQTAIVGVNGLTDPKDTSTEISNSTKITGISLPKGKHPGAL